MATRPEVIPGPTSRYRAVTPPTREQMGDDDVYYYIRWRLKLEGETENMFVCTKEGKGVTAAVLMATPCTNSLHFLREMAPPGWGCVVWTFGLVSAPSYPRLLSRSQPHALATRQQWV